MTKEHGKHGRTKKSLQVTIPPQTISGAFSPAPASCSPIKPTMVTLAKQKNIVDAFTDLDFAYLARNPYRRCLPNSKNIGHAIIRRCTDGKTEAWQYSLPSGKGEAPTVHSLHSIEEIMRYGQQRWRAKNSNGKTFYASRVEHARVKFDPSQVKAEPVDVAYFSEGEEEPFWGNADTTPLFRTDLSPERQAELDDAIEVYKGKTKGNLITVDPDSVRIRSANPKRKPSQKQVMGMSARDAYEYFFNQYEDKLHPQLTEILRRSFSADLYTLPESQYRPEWLHALAFSLMPISKNPQCKKNLGAAPSWSNTEMMILERIAKWFALHKEDADIVIDTLFEMLLNSELVETINFSVSIEFQDRFVHFIQELDAMKAQPVFRKASDIAQGAGITYAIIHGKKPISIEPVKALKSPAPQLTTTQAVAAAAGSSSPTAIAHLSLFKVDRKKAAPLPKIGHCKRTRSGDSKYLGEDSELASLQSRFHKQSRSLAHDDTCVKCAASVNPR